jgi:gamma-glutamyl phosphate reductase
MNVEEIKANLEYGRQAEKVVLHAVEIIRETDPKVAQELLEHPDYIDLLITRSKLEARLKELESGG